MTVRRPFLTVVVPTFNREAHIGRCLESVVSQGFEDLQVVVVDNASTDRTVEVASSFEDRLDLTVVVNVENQERAFSRNRGAAAAAGSFILFLDSDDVLSRGALDRGVEFIRSDSSYRFVFQLPRVVNEAGTLVYEPTVGRGPMNRVLAEGNPLSCSGVYIERDLFLEHRFDESPKLVASEDWHCWIRIAADCLPVLCPGDGAVVVDHAGRTMAADRWNVAEHRFAFLTEDLLAHPEVVEFLRPNLALFLATQDHYVAVKAAGERAFRVSVVRFLRAVRRYPPLISTRRTVHLIRLWCQLPFNRVRRVNTD
ncbi:MAG: glycosyltransferase family A protein [Acidimicrobiales bacterium]|nr:glycosyltransferase family A protein [Acidimicrobiales bacterium]